METHLILAKATLLSKVKCLEEIKDMGIIYVFISSSFRGLGEAQVHLRLDFFLPYKVSKEDKQRVMIKRK